MSYDSLVHTRVIEALNNREDLAAFFNDLFQNQRTMAQSIGPAVAMLVHCFVVAREGRFPVGTPDASLAGFLGFSENKMLYELYKNINSNSDVASRQLSGLVHAINFASSSGCTWHALDQPQQAPVPVSIVSMVERVTKTEIARSANGLVTGSRQTECDA